MVKVPRKKFARFIVRVLTRLLLPILAKVKVVGGENIPKQGKALLIGNHVAVMEPVMMVAYAPRQIEFLGSIDVPHEPSTRWAMDFYGMIEIFRGKPERQALKQALSVLEQGALLGIFPEGGLWNPGTMKPKDGVAFLSHRSGAPVIPIAFVGSKGALNDIFALKRPELKMIVGKPIAPCTVGSDEDIRQVYQEYSAMVMEKVFEQLPQSVREEMYDIRWEKFSMVTHAFDDQGRKVAIPAEVGIHHSEELALLLHRPGILKIFRVNLHMDIAAIEHLHQLPSPEKIQAAIIPMIEYLEDEKYGNPYLLTYRFDYDRGKAMLSGLKELKKLTEWAMAHQFTLHLIPERRFFSKKWEKEYIQVQQGEFNHWR
jgi:1-acyl-sn-glycerol-3-phosphate acyltransferase